MKHQKVELFLKSYEIIPMKKVLSTVLSTSLLLLPFVALGVEQLPQGPTTIDQFIALLNTGANWLFSILLAVAVIFIVLAAVQFVTGGGDPGAVEQARQKVVYAAIGVVVAVAAKGIVYVAKTFVQ
jgi:hypothetical protein